MRFAETPEDWARFELMLRGFLAEQEATDSPVLFTRRTLDRYRDLARAYMTGQLFGVVVLGEVETEAGQETVGFVLAGEDGHPPIVDLKYGKQAVVWLAYVTPEHRKSGAGLSMLHFGWPRLQEQGFHVAVMAVRESNQQGEALCYAFGAQLMERSFIFDLKETPRGLRIQQPAE